MTPEPSASKPLYGVTLKWEHCKQLANSIHRDDAFECVNLGSTPLGSLATGALIGPAYAALRRDTHECVGAFGCNPFYHTAWSLWSENLTRAEQIQLIREAPDYIRELHVRSKHTHRPFFNLVAKRNQRAYQWLVRSGCFRVEPEPDFMVGGEPYYYFETKVEELCAAR